VFWRSFLLRVEHQILDFEAPKVLNDGAPLSHELAMGHNHLLYSQ